ncbi:MAG: HAMP domain-containing histidine kinase [Clostridia bacterium]|nr:HAMP domain-containing histidine kinase [Clostridia bacterium]
MRNPFKRRAASDLPACKEEARRWWQTLPGWHNLPRRESLYMTLWTFLCGVILTAGLMAAAAYGFLVFFGLLVNPFYRMLAMPTLLMVFILMLAAGMGRSKLRPMNDLVHAMHAVSQGDFSVRVDAENVPGDMGELASSFNDMATELGGLELFRKDFINNFSHEFKTPIVSIRGFAKQLERDDLTEAQRREYLDIIVSESDRLANMASNVLLLSKLENQTIVTDKASYALDEQLRRAILLLEKQWTEKEIELDVDLEAVEYYGNEEMMNHVWVNLLNNAVKFSPQGAPLSVRLWREDGAAVARVKDAGPGMDADTRRRIFEKFYQGDTAHATEGNGLGLSLVKRIVDLCGGNVTVESTPGEGAAFTVRLPLEAA